MPTIRFTGWPSFILVISCSNFFLAQAGFHSSTSLSFVLESDLFQNLLSCCYTDPALALTASTQGASGDSKNSLIVQHYPFFQPESKLCVYKSADRHLKSGAAKKKHHLINRARQNRPLPVEIRTAPFCWSSSSSLRHIFASNAELVCNAITFMLLRRHDGSGGCAGKHGST